ncbi:MAG: RNA 2',3'-cyclic phosphodiesterase [Nitrospira defluvii]|nr:RNA 2',3'-cyclic phosphodiesterase [Nitrospira defluvii]
MIRAFLAIELPQELSTTLATIQQDLKRRLERTVDRHVRISWVRPASMHLTLKFLGDTAGESIESLQAAIEQAVSAHRAIAIPLERLGVFPRPQQPRVLWVGPSESWEQGHEAQRFTALHHAIEDCCQAANFAPEGRSFSPHLTLARIKEGERQVGQALAQSGVLDRPVMIGTLPVEAIVLMKSELRPTGSFYTKLWEVRIGGR